jgi:hypothetical protein
MSDAPRLPATYRQVTLVELVDRVLEKGVLVAGDITLSVADVDLIELRLRALLASAGTLDRPRDDRGLPLRDH